MSSAVKLIAMCSDANAAIACGVPVAGSARKPTRSSSSICCRRVASVRGRSANHDG